MQDRGQPEDGRVDDIMAAVDAGISNLADALSLGLVDGKWDDALRAVRSFAAGADTSPSVLMALGICYFHRREFSEAILWLERAAKRGRQLPDPQLAWPALYLFRGVAYAAKRLNSAAKADLSELAAYNPSPINWDRFSSVLRPDEIARARRAANAVGHPDVVTRRTIEQ